ncbi:50S ribosomal protein L3 N(5)-glutamine methyltransferase [Thiohalobacter sp.]|uniref:50S ribosomal protein L3 N(5)-glutamine methyltransferase n=1 Tax=Thiohalobacter sp. TaxID=2025948 RepID=UPI0026251C5A|nr:50S ribosomal protein L3 N(5)-glutamine methyltransferase [Thiohalobacter sp.]
MSEAIPPELRTARDFLRWGVSRFHEHGLVFGHGTDNAFDEARLLVTHALHLPFGVDDAWLDGALTAEERAAVHGLLTRRFRERIPAAYLTGEAWFAGLPFEVTPEVLIPRSPLAELIEARFAPWIDPERVTDALDLCTGSGCIAIATALHLPEARVDASDVSPAALAVAARNCARHGVTDRVRLVQSDLFAALADRRYDIIVSNPPYVDAGEMAALPPEYRHEPELGLAAGGDGLDLVRCILAEAGSHLNPGGILVVEVGNSAEALARAYPRLPLVWLEFERGGEGVFLLTAEQLAEHRAELDAARTPGRCPPGSL